MVNIFNTEGGGTISGVFGADGDDDTIVFSSIGEDTLDGFIIESYTLNWQRPIAYRRAFNKKGNIVNLGKGTGSLTLQGLVGPTDEFEALMKATSGNSVCKTANCVISTGGGYSTCNSDGTQSKESGNLTITAQGIVLQGITMAGSLQEGAVSLTNATLTFKVGGVKLGN